MIVPGGIGTGADNVGVPVLEGIVRLLAEEFDVTVFSLFPVRAGYIPRGFELVSITANTPAGKAIKLITALRHHHRKKRFRLIHGFWTLPSGFLAVIAGKIFGLPSVVSVLGGDAVALPEIQYGELRKWLNRRLILWSLRQCNEVIVLTKYLADSLKVFGLTRVLHVVPWGIDTGMFQFKEKPLSDPIQFLHIANHIPVKDPVTTLRAFQLIGRDISARLTIIGAGPLEGQLHTIANELGIRDRVVFLKPMPYAELPRYYAEADILLHTSLSEGQSEVVTEAMTSGVIVCGTAVGLLYDLPDCCISVPVRSYEGLAAAVVAVIKDTNRMNAVRLRARMWAQEHSILWTAQEIGKIYDQLV